MYAQSYYMTKEKVANLVRALFISIRKKHWIDPKFCVWNLGRTTIIPKISMVKNSCPEEISPMAFEKHVLNGWGISVGNFFNDMFEKKIYRLRSFTNLSKHTNSTFLIAKFLKTSAFVKPAKTPWSVFKSGFQELNTLWSSCNRWRVLLQFKQKGLHAEYLWRVQEPWIKRERLQQKKWWNWRKWWR